MRLDNSYDGLTQWDTGRKIILESYEICDQIHFSNKTFGKTIDVLVYKVEDSYLADIPDELLQSPSPITVYCYIVRDDGETTTISETFPVRKRNKPTDYIYNPESQTRIKEFNEFVDDTITEMKDIESKVSESTKHQPIIQNGTWFIWDVVNNVYTDTGVFAQGPKGDKGDTGEQGLQGPKGDKGDTPVKGIDYFTNEDIESLGIDGKADKSSTLSGYGITDAYTKTETDGKLDTKVDKESGKGLSANDYTNTDKAKVDNLPDDTQSELDAKANSADLVNYVKNTDIATASELGIVKFNASFGISVNANGQPFINKAPQSVIDNRAENLSASYYPIVPSNLDYAVSKSTHQDMSEDYDTSTLIVSTSFDGNQGQLPVSYDASKGYIDAKFNDSTPITTTSGYPLMVTDHLEGETVINYQVYGNSTQATRSGKNLIKYPYDNTARTINGITFTDNGDGTITANGTATNNAYFYLNNLIEYKSGDYYLSGCPTGGSVSTYLLTAINADSNYTLYKTDIGSGVQISLSDSDTLKFQIRIMNGTTVNNLIFKPQLEVGTTATAYEQYGVMPSPDYPSEIQSVGDLVTDETSEHYGKYDIPIVCRGKNLLPYPYYNTTRTENGVTWTDNGDGTITVSGTATGYTAFSLVTRKQGVIQPNKEYIFSHNGVDYQNIVVDITLYDKDENPIRNINANSSFTTAENEELITINIKRSNLGTVSGTFKPQLEEGSIATEYEPYIPPVTTNIYLDEPLRKVGDYADYIDFKGQKVVRNVKEKIFDGTETFGDKYIASANRITHPFPHLADSVAMLTRSIWKSTATIWANNENLAFDVSYYDVTTVDEFKTKLAEWYANGEPLKMYYVSETPTEEPITVPELTSSNSAVMNVSSGTATQPSQIDLTYYQDINKKLDEIHEDISNTQSELDTKANSSDLVNYVKFTDYATSSKAGVVKYNVSFGIGVNSEGYVYTVAANKNEIDLKTTSRKPIVPSNLDYAVRSVYPITQTALSDPITVNTIYDLGLQTALTITLPSGQLGDFIEFNFVSGTTATSLTVSSSNGIIGYDLIPEANNIYTLYFDWGVIACDTTGVQTYGWRCNYFEYAITLSEPSST